MENDGGLTAASRADVAPAKQPLRVLLFLLLVLGLLSLLVSRMTEVGALLFRLLVPALLVALECLALSGVMHALRRVLTRLFANHEPSEGTLAPSFAADLILGYPLFGVVCYLVGLLRVSAPVMGTLVCAFAIVGLVLRRKVHTPAVRPLLCGRTGKVALALLGIIFGIAFLQAQLPAFSLDEIAYHLAVPRAWVNEGRVVALELNSQSFYPSGIEAADLPFLSLLGAQGAVASHLMHTVIALATCSVLFSWLRSRSDDDSALVCVSALASTPALIMTAGWSWNEWPLLGICVLSLSGLDEFAEQRASVGRTVLNLGVPAAAGLLCKYTFLGFAAPVLVAAIIASLRDAAKRAALGRAVAFASALGLLFYVRNLVLTGNPVEPFLSRISPQISGFRSAAQPRELFLSYVFDAGVADEALGVSLFALTLSLSWCWRGLEKQRSLLYASVGISLVLVLVTLLGPSSRILVPFLAGAGVLAFIALHRTLSEFGGLYLALASLLVLAASQVAVGACLANSLAPYSTLSGKAPDRTFLRNFAGGRSSYPRVEWIDAQLPEHSLTLVVGLHQLYHFSHRVRGGGDFDGARVARYLDQGSEDALYARLRRDGFTHIAVFASRLVTTDKASSGLRAELETVMTPEAMARFQRFLAKYTKPLARERNMEVFALR